MPAVEMVLKVDVSKAHAEITAKLINKWHSPVYLDQRFVPQSKYLTSDWGDLYCSNVKIKYYGLRYNSGNDLFIKLKPGEALTSSKVNLADDYAFPDYGNCTFNVSFWVSTNPFANDDLSKIFFMKSNTIEFQVDNMNFDVPFLKRHKELQ